MKSIWKNVELTNGKVVDIEKYSRGGTDSPTLSLMVYNGKRYTPYQQDKLGWKVSFGAILKAYLPDELIKEEMIKENWLSKRILPYEHDAWHGGCITLPLADSPR